MKSKIKYCYRGFLSKSKKAKNIDEALNTVYGLQFPLLSVFPRPDPVKYLTEAQDLILQYDSSELGQL